MKKKILLLLPLLFSLASCGGGQTPLSSVSPVPGPQGPQGPAGHSPELTIGSNGNWFIDGVDTGIKATGADGEDGKDGTDGKDGQDGEDGLTPHVGENGNWWIGDQDTGVKAEGQDGEDGKDGLTPHIGSNGNWWIGDVDTGISARGPQGTQGPEGPQGPQGEQGLTPHVGENGNWWIGDQDTGYPVIDTDLTIGENGNWFANGEDTGFPSQGHSPEITIGENGNWYIDGMDTGRPASVTTTYVVTLDPNGGQFPEGAIQSYQVYSGSCISSLPVPTRNNYEFLGWYTGMEETDGLFTTTTPVQSDLNLVARWQSLAEETYTVTWVNYNGSVLERDYGVGRGDYPSYDGETPTRPYGSDGKQYTFSGWSPSLSYVYEDITYVAQYTESLRRLTVTFDVGEYGSIASESQVVEWGKGVSEPEIDISSVPGNVVFTGWYGDVDLTEQVVFPYVPTSDITLHAGWEVVEDVSDRLTFYYDSSYDGYVVRSYNETDAVRTVVIPDTWNDGINGVKNVVGIQGAFSSNRNVETVVLPSSLKFIGEYAFSNSSVRNINYPDTLESIGQYAFNHAPIVDGDLSNTKLTEISQYSFCATNIGALSLPESVISIGSHAFEYCRLTTAIIPENVTKMGGSTFAGCSLLTIYCKANALPESGWADNWNGDSLVYWYSEEDPGSTPGNYWHYNEEGKPWKW